jgi:KDO2-lipid IV(A) lauroyltransferase
MNAIFYYLSLPFLYLIAYLPFRIMYLFSDFLYLLIYRVFGYRKKIVTENLQNSFPEKSAAEIDKIRRDHYRYFCDLSLEIIKSLTISPAELKKHFVHDDLSVFERFYKEKQSIILVMGHLGNWELAGAFFSQFPLHQLYVIYHPLASKHFDQLFYHMRTRSGIKLYPMKESFKGMVKNRKDITATAFIADQTPRPDNAHWMTFLNQDTAVFKGTENIAKKLDYPVVYISVIREKRGVYRLGVELLAEHPNELTENELTELHTRRLERDIIKYPETWLWSHRRWKHKKPE